MLLNDAMAINRSASEEMHRAVRALPPSGSDVVENNLGFITKMGKPEIVVRLLQSLIEDEASLCAIAARSYHHVNHFDKIILVDSNDPTGYRLTMHVWDPPYTAEEVREELIHDHRFNFWSCIVTGAVTSKNFLMTGSDRRDARPYRRYGYVRTKASRQGSEFSESYEFTGEVALALGPDENFKAGDSYFMPYERIHRVLLPRDRMACTIVLRGPRQRAHSNVYNAEFPTQDVKRENTTFTQEILRTKLVRIAQTIAEDHQIV